MKEEPRHILPKLVPRRELELLRWQGVESLPAAIAITEGLWLEVDVAKDLPRTRQSVTEVLEHARRNLLAISREPWIPIAPGLFRSPWADGFDGARLALPTLFSRIGVRGDPIITLPHHGAVLVTGTEEREGLALLYAATRMIAAEDAPLHLAALRLVGGSWRELHADDIALVTAVPKLAHLEYLQDTVDYATLGESVRAAIHAAGYHAESLSSGELDGTVFTYTQLSRANKLVIPRAALVVCNEQTLHWYRLADVLGKNLAAIDVWPLHYEVRRFPTVVEIKAAKL